MHPMLGIYRSLHYVYATRPESFLASGEFKDTNPGVPQARHRPTPSISGAYN